MSDSRHAFPLGKAYGSAFCNREKETDQLLGHIKSGKHVLLIAPRRYGKSSLAERAIEKSTYPAVKVNFHLSTNEAEVAQLIMDSVSKLIGIAIGPVDKIINSIKRYLVNCEPSLTFGDDIATLKLLPKKQENYAVMIVEALLLIEKLLKEKKQKAVIFFDEFQEISLISKHNHIEGAIRTAAQEMQNLSILFSGSIRSLLLSMFEDENRPLYKLCRKIKLERIDALAYEKHIQKIAKATWKNSLDIAVFEKIMQLSNRHPYYVNYLCDTIWENNAQLPTLTEVEAAWHEVVMEEWGDAIKELGDLSMGQRRLLKYLANNQVRNIQSQAVAKKLSMATSSIATATHALLEKDYLETDENRQYQIVNPLLLAVLRGMEN